MAGLKTKILHLSNFFLKECNICKHKSVRFESSEWHKYIICPNCKSQVRHRLLIAALTEIDEFKKEHLLQGKSVLHFAPEKFSRSFFTEHSFEYTTADLFAPGYSYKNIDLQIDIADMTEVNDETYDICVAIDVLEHVAEDLRAISEIYRILKPAGYAIISVPQKDHLKKTISDPGVTDPEERLLKFGQKDHLRIYGSDFKEMLSSTGFTVSIVDENSFPKEFARKHVLYPSVLSQLEFATNFRKIYFARK